MGNKENIVVIRDTKILASFANGSDAWIFVAEKLKGKDDEEIMKWSVGRASSFGIGNHID